MNFLKVSQMGLNSFQIKIARTFSILSRLDLSAYFSYALPFLSISSSRRTFDLRWFFRFARCERSTLRF